MRFGVASSCGLCLIALPGVAFATTYKVGPTQQHKQLGDVAGLLAPGDDVETCPRCSGPMR